MVIAWQLALSACGLASWLPMVRARTLRTDAAALPAWNQSWFGAVFSALSTALVSLLVSLSLSHHPVMAAAAFPIAIAGGSLLTIQLTGGPVLELFKDFTQAPKMAFVTLIRSAPFIALAALGGNWIFKGQIEPAVDLLRHASFGTRSLAVVSATLLAPIGEELFFRGVIYRWLRGRVSVMAAAWISAILFAAFHMSPASAPALLIFGFAAAYSAEVAGGLTTPILFHVFFNTLQVVFILAS